MNVTPLFICRLLKREPITPWKELLDSLENDPKDWICGSCTLMNKRHKAGLWISNGYQYFKMYPGDLKIPVSQRYRIYKAVNEIQAALFKTKE